MWSQIQRLAGTEPYLVIDTEANWLYVRRGEEVLLKTMISTGSGKKLEEQGGRKWTFMTPKGVFTILRKEENPVWYKPDWLYEQEMTPTPPLNAQERLIAGPMGTYALFFGDGFVIHGRPADGAPPMVVDHACIVLEDEDLRAVFKMLDTGSFAYIR